MNGQRGVAIGLLLLAVVAAGLGAVRAPAKVAFGATIALVRVEGTIAGGSDAAGASADRLMDTLEKVRKDPAVKAVVLRVNSPGGTVAASYEIGREIERLRAVGKPVITSMGDVAASGGYWVAAHTDYIVASPGTITGSIGVITRSYNVSELFKKLGVEPETVKSGKFKDMFSESRALTDEERALAQSMIDDTYREFVAVVAKGRKLPEEKVREIADGRIISGMRAKELGLVDELGNLNDAYQKAAKVANLSEGSYEIKVYGRTYPWERFFGGIGSLVRLGETLRALLASTDANAAVPQATWEVGN